MSCYQDVIDLNLSEKSNQIVIEGIVNDQSGTSRVSVSGTGEYYESDVSTPVIDAVVIISDDAGNSDTLRQATAGLYRTTSTFRGVTGRTYTLTVTVNGEKYTASSQMPEALEMDYFRYVQVSDRNYNYSLLFFFTDYEDNEDFCRFRSYMNGYIIKNNDLYRDKYIDGEQNSYEAFSGTLNINDEITVIIQTVDETFYEYLSMIHGEIDFDAELPDLFPMTSFNPPSNISNNGLGYFAAYSQREYTYVSR